MYGDEIVSFGHAFHDYNLPDLKFDFKSNLIDTKEIDMRNLILCKQLNLYKSPILTFDTKWLSELRVLVLYIS